jgi:hypothetical protein
MGHFSAIIHEIEAMPRLRGGVSFRHESRRSNGEAHSLARYATTLQPGRHLWLALVEKRASIRPH